MKLVLNKKMNIIITASVLAIAAFVAIWTGIKFTKFRNYEAEFIIREDVVSETIKFSEYSKNLEGTFSDSEIYVIQGTENTVAVAKAVDESKYNTLTAINSARVYGVDGTDQYTAGLKTLSNLKSKADYETLVSAVNANEIDVAIVSYSQAKALVKANSNLTILDVEVEKVPSVLVIGGTHPNEPSGQLTATVFLENACVQRGTLYVITELNKSAYSYSQPQEATTWYYRIKTQNGYRTFKYGSRATNTVDQWPTPDVYTHSSGQQLSSSEVRNINRAYPGSETGTYTEQIAYAVTNFVNQNDVTIVIDLHEASPEYKTINACVYHDDCATLSSKTQRFLRYENEQGKSTKLDITLDVSPSNMHGLTHREVGDYTGAYVFLFETSNASQGKLRGAFSADLIRYETEDGEEFEDKFYEAAVAYDEENGTEIIYGRPVSISERVARHTLSILAVINGFNEIGVTRTVSVRAEDSTIPAGYGGVEVGKFVMSNVPSYNEIEENGVGYYLLDSQR